MGKYRKLYNSGVVVTLVIVIIFNFVSIVPLSQGNLSLKSLIMTANAWGEDPISPGQTGTWDSCVIDLGGGWFKSGVEYKCHDQYVCPSCTCTPIACAG